MRIQIIDDERAIASTLQEFIVSLGYECEAYSDPCQALAQHGRGHYDVVLTDLRMPGLNGLQLLEQLCRQHPGTLVIAMTGQADMDSAMACLDRGAYAYFRKPLDLRRLVNTLQRAERELTGQVAHGTA